MFVKAYSTIQVVFTSAVSILLCNVIAVIVAIYALPAISRFLFF